MKQRDIFWFWLPLFASWLLMTAEGPIITATLNRLPEKTLMVAAYGIVVSLSVTIESPIINILATSTALVKDRASYLLVRKFVVHWSLVLTAVSLLIAYTPLFNVVVRGWLETPAEVADWVRPGLQIMVLWSAAIAWRRFLQGIMIHFNQTRSVAWGTVVRLLTSAGVVVVIALFTEWPGVINGSIALIAGVVAEAIYATVAVQPLLKSHLGPESQPASGKPLTYSELFWFHLPLAGTSLLVLLAQPLVTSSLSRLDRPVESLAAWPIVYQVTLMTRAAAFALPEVVIALSKSIKIFPVIRRFSLNMAGVLTLFMALFTLTPLLGVYIFDIQNMPLETGTLAQSGMALFLFYPALAVFAAWLRGLLIHYRITNDVNTGMVINLVITAVILFVGLLLRLPGLPTAAVSLNVAAIIELVYLGWRAKRVLPAGMPLFRFHTTSGD